MHRLLPDLPTEGYYILIIVLALINIFRFFRSRKALKEKNNEDNRYFYKLDKKSLIVSSVCFIVITILFLTVPDDY